MGYLGDCFWPTGLHALYPYVPGKTVLSLEFAVVVTILTALTIVGVALAKRYPVFIVAWGMYVVALTPVIGLVQVGFQAKADRYTYLLNISITVLFSVSFVWIVEWLRENYGSKLLTVMPGLGVVLAITALLTMQTQRQVGVWRDGPTLWANVVQHEPEAVIARQQYGNALFEEGRVEQAMAQYRAGLELRPNDAGLLNNLAVGYLDLDDTYNAEQFASMAVGANRTHGPAYNTLGEVYMGRRRYDVARRYFETAIELDGLNAPRTYNLAIVMEKLGLVRESCLYWSQYLRLVDKGVTEARRAMQRLRCDKLSSAATER